MKRRKLIIASLIVIVLGAVALALYAAITPFNTTLEFQVIDVVSKNWVWDATIKLQNRTIRSFYQSDVLVLLPIYPAGEKRIKGVDSQTLYQEIKAHGHKEVYYQKDFPAALAFLKKKLKPGDILLTLGAGNVWQLGSQLLDL